EARVFDRALDKLSPVRRQAGDMLGFARGKIVEQYEPLARSVLKEGFREVRADEARAAGDQIPPARAAAFRPRSAMSVGDGATERSRGCPVNGAQRMWATPDPSYLPRVLNGSA